MRKDTSSFVILRERSDRRISQKRCFASLSLTNLPFRRYRIRMSGGHSHHKSFEKVFGTGLCARQSLLMENLGRSEACPRPVAIYFLISPLGDSSSTSGLSQAEAALSHQAGSGSPVPASGRSN